MRSAFWNGVNTGKGHIKKIVPLCMRQERVKCSEDFERLFFDLLLSKMPLTSMVMTDRSFIMRSMESKWKDNSNGFIATSTIICDTQNQLVHCKTKMALSESCCKRWFQSGVWLTCFTKRLWPLQTTIKSAWVPSIIWISYRWFPLFFNNLE